MDPYVERCLDCANYFRASCPEERELPTTFADEQEAFECLRDVHLFEAHKGLQDPIDEPASVVLNAVDLQTDEPGICRVRNGALDVSRGSGGVRRVEYGRQIQERKDESVPPLPVAASVLEKAVQAAKRKEERRMRTLENQAEVATMSKEERKAMREEKKKKREERKAERGGDAGEERSAKEEKREREKEPPPAPQVEEVADVPKDAPVKRRRGEKVVFYESPAPYDRHLTALTAFGIHDSLEGTILRGSPPRADGLLLLQGPPGTGKTVAILDELVRFRQTRPEGRCLVCSPTNVGVADLYKRSMQRGVVGALALAKEHVPIGTPRANFVDVAAAKVVFSTISGRAGPMLMDQAFDAVFVDEAAHVSEATCLGVLRPEVTTLVLAGDVAQLPAQVSEEGKRLNHGRSLLERLVGIGVESKTLTLQHRMREEIVAFPNAYFYGGSLRTAERQTPHPDVAPYLLCHVDAKEERVGTSYENAPEAERAVQEAEKLRDAGVEDVVILAPYLAHARRILSKKSGFPVLTCDAFQGKEADGVVLCIVRTEAPGFFAEERRLNVGLTRARDALRVVTNVRSWEGRDGCIGSLVRDAKDRQLVA